MNKTELTQAMTTTNGGQRYGGDEVVTDALREWVFEGAEGTINLAFGTGPDQLRCSIALPRLKGKKSSVEVMTNKDGVKASDRPIKEFAPEARHPVIETLSRARKLKPKKK